MSFQITILEAVLRRQTSPFSEMDPYAVVKVGTKQQKSFTIKSGGKKPKWVQKFEFKYIEILSTMNIQLYDENMMGDQLIGGIAPVSLKQYINITQQKTEIFDLFFKESQIGKLKIKINYNPNYNPPANKVPSQNIKYPQLRMGKYGISSQQATRATYIPPNPEQINIQNQGYYPQQRKIPQPNSPNLQNNISIFQQNSKLTLQNLPIQLLKNGQKTNPFNYIPILPPQQQYQYQYPQNRPINNISSQQFQNNYEIFPRTNLQWGRGW